MLYIHVYKNISHTLLCTTSVPPSLLRIWVVYQKDWTKTNLDSSSVFSLFLPKQCMECISDSFHLHWYMLYPCTHMPIRLQLISYISYASVNDRNDKRINICFLFLMPNLAAYPKYIVLYIVTTRIISYSHLIPRQNQLFLSLNKYEKSSVWEAYTRGTTIHP